MTDAEWSQCDNLVALLSHLQRQRGVLRTKRGRSKVWLFIAACFRSSWHLLSHEGRAVVELFERHTDDAATQVEFKAWQEAMFVEYKATYASSNSAKEQLREWLTFAVWQLTIPRNTQEAVQAVYQWDAQVIRSLKEWHHFAQLMRDIYGNPFRTIVINPAWLTPTVLALAQTAYEERTLPAGTLDNAHLAVLADALEDAGCTNQDLLNHCRQPGEHVRGCWVVDLLLGKQ